MKTKTILNNKKEIDLSGISKAIEYKPKNNYDVLIVQTNKDLADAKKNIKTIEADKTEYKNRIKPLKAFLDGLHKKITGVEKENCSIFDKAIDAQQEKIDAFKLIEYQRQQEIERRARELAEKKAAEEKAIVEEQARKEAAAKRRAATLLEKQGASRRDVQALRAEAEEIRNDAAEYDPGIVPEKVVLARDRIEEKFEYFIADENAFISWALQCNRELLNISVNKKNFNTWIKESGNREFSFIGRESILR